MKQPQVLLCKAIVKENLSRASVAECVKENVMLHCAGLRIRNDIGC